MGIWTGGPHGHAADGSGGHLVRPRLYEYAAAIEFLGQRRRVYDRLITLSGARRGDRVLAFIAGALFLFGENLVNLIFPRQ